MGDDPSGAGDLENPFEALNGRVFTHRLTGAEIVCDAVLVTPDLAAIEMLFDGGIAVVDRDGRMLAEPARWAFEDSARGAVLEENGLDPKEPVLLPMGVFRDCAAGDTIGLRIVGTEDEPGICVIPVVPSEIADMPSDFAERIAALSGRRAGPAPEPPPSNIAQDAVADVPLPDFIDLYDLVVELCEGDASLFTAPLPPLGEMLSAAGYVVIDGDVLPAGVDEDRWRLSRDAARIARRYGISAPDALAIAVISQRIDWAARRLARVTQRLVEEADPSEAAELGEDLDADLGEGLVGDADAELVFSSGLLDALADPDVAEALLAEALGSDIGPAAPLGALAESWENAARSQSRVALRWIQSRCLERLGNPEAAEEHLHEARAIDADWPPVLEDLARYASERGDAGSAISLLRRAGVPDDDGELAFLLRLPTPRQPNLGRNQSCWCGSGRKYKQCHLRREALPLADRAMWLYRKAVRYLESGSERYRMIELAEIRSMYNTSVDALYQAVRDPFLYDVLLFEGGVAADYAAERGYLLPDDERALLDLWLLTTRSVYEVEEVRYGRGLTVRDIRTGDRRHVAEKTASRQLKKGMRLLMRIAPVSVEDAVGGAVGEAAVRAVAGAVGAVGEGGSAADAVGTSDGQLWQIFGGLEPIGMHQEQAAMALCDALEAGEAGPQDLVEFTTARFAPPTMRTTDGAEMVHCTARYTVDDPGRLEAFLADRFRDGGGGTYTATEGSGPFPTVTAHLELRGAELTVETMNEIRLEGVQRTLEAASGLALQGVERVSAAAMMRRASVPDERAASGHSDGLPGASGALNLPGALDPPGAPNPPGSLGPADPAVAEALAQVARHFEQRWLDESIPALGGLTPRQAADDPTRREDLVRLLDTFETYESNGQPGQMSAARLRVALDL